MKITELFLHESPGLPKVFTVGDTVEGFIEHHVKAIEYKKYEVFGADAPCYVVTFEGIEIRKTIPASRMVEITVDTGKKPQADEDVGVAGAAAAHPDVQ